MVSLTESSKHEDNKSRTDPSCLYYGEGSIGRARVILVRSKLHHRSRHHNQILEGPVVWSEYICNICPRNSLKMHLTRTLRNGEERDGPSI